MPINRLEYNGIPQLRRQRTLQEEGEAAVEHKNDRILDEGKSREDAVTDLFQEVAATYLKGNALRRALREMEPLGWISIEEGAESVIAAARRFDDGQSFQGKRITYSMYQTAIDNITEKNWNIRRKYLNVEDIPITPEVHHKVINQEERNRKKSEDFLSDYIDGVGIAGVLLGFLTGSIFDSKIFSALSSNESGAKGVQAIDIPLGIVVLLELGIKAVRIIEMLKSMKADTPELEAQVELLENSVESRKQVFEESGLDYDVFVENQIIRDSKTLVNYVKDYFQRFSGIIRETQTIDHWLAYGTVAANQNTIRSALNTADTFSTEFANIRSAGEGTLEKIKEEGEGVISSSLLDDVRTNLHTALASSLLVVNQSTNTMYDNIASNFLYKITDRDLCCLLQIVGGTLDPEFLRTLAKMCALIATTLGANLTVIFNALAKALANIFRDAIYEILADLNKLYEKVVKQLTEVFDLEIPGLETCVGLFTIGQVLIEMAQTLEAQIRNFLQEVLTLVLEMSLPDDEWEMSADRTHLLGIAKVLNTIAIRLEAVEACAKRTLSPQNTLIEAADDIMSAMLLNPQPTLAFTDQELEDHFPGLEPRKSTRFGFIYGTTVQQKTKGTSISQPVPLPDREPACIEDMTPEEIQEARDALKRSVETVFRTNER